MDYGHSLKLTSDWDLTLDAAGNIATCTGPEAIAQDVATTLRLFTNDAYYEPNAGIPHFATHLGRVPLLTAMTQRFTMAAQAVPSVATATVKELKLDTKTRTLTGQIDLTLKDGATITIDLNGEQ